VSIFNGELIVRFSGRIEFYLTTYKSNFPRRGNQKVSNTAETISRKAIFVFGTDSNSLHMSFTTRLIIFLLQN
jgi:hypothetical protein